ncbi:MAG: hypothetical protein OEV40_08875 [Acidimicrobiia bacterium]|nr:hypothetical protein [Acidimicrobiia bacterium]
MFELTAVEPPWRLAYRILGPHSILLPGGAFDISRHGSGSLFRASIRYRFGRLTQLLFNRRMSALRRHMREEGKQLKHLVESGAPADGDR